MERRRRPGGQYGIKGPYLIKPRAMKIIFISELPVTLGAIAAVIIFLVWHSRIKYLRLTTLLTKQINGIPDQNINDKVTAKIKDDALTARLEGQLRGLLAKNVLLGKEAWETQAGKINPK